MTVTAKQILVKARAILAEPASWTKRANARIRRDGMDSPAVGITYEYANCFCLNGALIKASYELRAHEIQSTPFTVAPFVDAQHILDSLTPEGWYIGWNDAPERTHGEVLELLDRAIDKAGQDEVSMALLAGEPLHSLEARQDAEEVGHAV